MPKRGTQSDPKTRRALGGALRAARLRSGKSQVALAQEIGISQAVVSFYETGQREPSFATLVRLADAVGLDLAEPVEIVRAEGD